MSSQPIVTNILKLRILGTLLALVVVWMVAKELKVLTRSQARPVEEASVIQRSQSRVRVAPSEITHEMRSRSAVEDQLAPMARQGGASRDRQEKKAPNLAVDAEKVDSFSQDEQASVGRKSSSIRQRLLGEAIDRALHSETPWSDVAKVALGFQRAGDRDNATRWFTHAAKVTPEPDEPKKSNKRLREVVEIMIAARELEMAKSYLDRFSLASERDRTAAKLVKAYAKDYALIESKSIAPLISDEKVRAKSYQLIAERELQGDDASQALQTLELIQDRGLRHSAYGKIAASLVKAGEKPVAMDLIHRISDPAQQDRAFGEVAKVESANSQRFYAALSLIRDPFFKDQTLRSLVEGEAKRRRIDFAEDSVRQIQSPQEQSRAQEALVQLQVKEGELSGALQRAQTIPDERSRYRAIESVAIAEVQKEGLRAARGTAHLIPSERFRDATLRKVAERAARFGEQYGAVETINYVRDPGERAMAFAQVALTEARKGDDRSAFRFVQDANRELLETSNQSREAKTTSLLAEVYAETGNADTAFHYADSIANRHLRDRTFQRMALQFARSREPDLAESSAERIERSLTRERTLDSVAATYAKLVPLTAGLEEVEAFRSRSQQVEFLVALATRS